MPEEALVDHIFVHLEPQVQDYVEVRNPTTTAQLLEVLAKFEERGNYESGRQRNQWFESRNELNGDDRRFDRGHQSGNRVQSEHFSRGNQRQGGRLNVLKVKDDQIDQSQLVKEVPIKLSAICMSLVELPYVPILLDETFAKALWDTDKPGLTHVLYHEIDTGDKPPVVSRPYRYDKVKQSILDYHIEKMLKDGVIPILWRRTTDEAHFWLNGYVNKQNCRIWSEANPQVYVETPLHPEKLTVWCALWA
ncbi:uncharacterized protein TNCV_22541 [Trichonephila clavipes]|nr:uncharacterized protein TNCV_22541 [Trichonephila clavipes]